MEANSINQDTYKFLKISMNPINMGYTIPIKSQTITPSYNNMMKAIHEALKTNDVLKSNYSFSFVIKKIVAPARHARGAPARRRGADPALGHGMAVPAPMVAGRQLERLGIRQSMSRKGNCLDNAATEQVFGHLKDEFYRGRAFDSYERFKHELDAYIVHWNTRRRQIRLEGRTPEEFRSMSLAV